MLVKDGQIYSFKQLKQDYPNMSFPAYYPDSALASIGVYRAEVEPQPIYNERTQTIVRNAPGLVDGNWKITWSVNNMTTAQQLAYHKERTLDAEQFEVFIIDSGLDDVFDAMLNFFKGKPAHRVNLAKLRAFLKSDYYRLGTVMAIIDRFSTQIANAFPSLDLTKPTLIAKWDAAEATDVT